MSETKANIINEYRIVPPQLLRTEVELPASKSISNRVLMVSALTDSTALPQHLSDCDDTSVMVDALTHMPPVIDIHGAGTAMRFLTAYLAATPGGTHTLTGTKRMQQRPIKVLVDALRHLGATIDYAGREGYPPLRITGQRLDGGEVEVAGNVSSQFISALLMIGPALQQGLTLRLTGDIVSRPYIDLTIWVMHEYGADVEWTSVDTISVKPKPYRRPHDYFIESDWSAASYWYEMVALSPDKETEVRLMHLADGSRQGDSSVRYIFSLLGVKTKFQSHRDGRPTTVTLRKNGHCVRRLVYDFAGAPDLAQTIVATCCARGIAFRFTGLQTLRIKETDRIAALTTEMLKLGYVLKAEDDGVLVWDGETVEPVALPAIDTYDDHRMAMAIAPVAFVRQLTIRQPQVVTKSYPHFWDDLTKAGFKII